MNLREFRGGRLLLALGVTVLSVIFFGRLASSIYVEILWFRSVGFSSILWTRILWEWGIRGLGALFVGLIVFLNFRIIAKTLGGIRIKRRVGDLVISEQLPESYVLWGILLSSTLMGAWFGASIPSSMGLQVLFLLNAPVWGVTDPVFGKDLAFFVILLPVLTAIVTFGVVITFLVFTLSSAGYAATGSLQWRRGRIDFEDKARRHLAVLLASFFLLLAVRFWLGRYLLLLNGSSAVQNIFGFADAEARLSALYILTLLAVFVAGGALWSGFKGYSSPLVFSLGTLVIGGGLVGQAYPSFIQRFRVEPNELERETPYIEHNLRFTQMGFNLTDLQRREFDYERPELGVNRQDAASQFSGLPVWSSQALLTIFRALEARFPYYDFSGVTVDRYETPEGMIPVALSVREVLPSGIQDPNWQNLHLRDDYIRGMGVVASEASARTPEGRPPMFVSGIPPEFTLGGSAPENLRLIQPDVYIGSRRQEYAVVDPENRFGMGERPNEPGVDLPEGILLDSPLKTLALAWRFSDANLMFSSQVNRTSRFLFRRSVRERVSTISGDLLYFPEAPYPVIHEGRIVWILEGFTGTRWFPLSTLYSLEPGRPLRYTRNSVKVTVDAVSGEIDFFVADEADPLLEAYRQALPALFRPLSDMPEELRKHIRYPKAMLGLQARVLFQYHQETARLFHGQQDVWTLPQELAQGTSPVPYQPEYGLYRLPGESTSAFLLTSVFVPRGRQNLTAILTAQSEPDRYGELILFDVPVEDQVPGPRQVEALIEQDPIISQQFSLWRTGGSQVWTGHLHLIPVGKTLLYMEPVFLAAEEDAIPELRRFVVSDGHRVSMEETLEEAIQALLVLALDSPLPSVAPASMVGTQDPTILDTSDWPVEALALLERGEQALREGDFQAFGESLAELRDLLETLSAGGRE